MYAAVCSVAYIQRTVINLGAARAYAVTERKRYIHLVRNLQPLLVQLSDDRNVRSDERRKVREILKMLVTGSAQRSTITV